MKFYNRKITILCTALCHVCRIISVFRLATNTLTKESKTKQTFIKQVESKSRKKNPVKNYKFGTI